MFLLVSNNGAKELLHASCWCYSCSRRRNYRNWYSLLFVFLLYVLASPITRWLFFYFSCLNSLVFKFVEAPENNEKPMEQKSGVKFKIMSLKMKVPTDYMPELVCENGSNWSESERGDKIEWDSCSWNLRNIECSCYSAVWGAKRSCLRGTSNACGILGSRKP